VISVGNIGGGFDTGFRGQIVQDFANDRLFIWEISSNTYYDEVNLTSAARTFHNMKYNIDRNVEIEGTHYIEFDGVNNRFLSMDLALGGLVAYNHASNKISLISVMHISEGRSFGSPKNIAVDINNERYFVADSVRETVWQVNSNNGNRENLRFNILDGTGLNAPAGIRYSQAENAIAVFNATTMSISIIDLERREHRLVSGGNVGSGPAFSRIIDLAFDEDNDRLLVIDSNESAIFSVDPVTGAREIYPIDGHRLNLPGLYIDGERTLIAYRLSSETIMADVNLDTGIKTELARTSYSVSAWAHNRREKKAYLLTGSSIISLDLHSNQEQVISNNIISEGLELGRGHITWDDVSDNVFLSQDAAKIIALDPISGDRLMISK
jgi:hypothetical protein